MAKKLLNDDKLISLVQARSVIYDKTDRFYTSKNHVRDAWKEIAIEMNTTVVACQKRWRYLRDYFVRQLHMLPDHSLTNINAFANGNGKKKTLWSLFNRLKFLAPFSSTRRGRCKIEDFDFMLDCTNVPDDELNCTNSLSSNNSAQHSYDLNYLQLLRYQQQLGDYMRTAERNADNKTPSEGSEYQLVVDVDQYNGEEEQVKTFEGAVQDEVEHQGQDEVEHQEQEQNDDEETASEIQAERSFINSLEDRTTSTCSTSKRTNKRRHLDTYEELVDILRNKRYEIEYDEHEHFFKSLLASVRKIDDEHIMAFRTEILHIVSKYLYMSQGENVTHTEEDTSDIVVIETDQLHWRKNLRKYKI